ncbi:Ig-like domain-containing protein [Aquibacillus koreensis]|uniref:Ig-like domain-containing protein n=1 Tax=Aquibacillus koreensis TaxID=279446 RepID=A0A9X3WMB3_9BACI|nr:SwmB domain-containing protein [Aquibacillus koreensis]MCT2537136.1 SwmB domain-containing protein [Aquibacillus koreensis]MDC3419881.1 Ig-like domain-containing protein [Aquibacillus koreensis]
MSSYHSEIEMVNKSRKLKYRRRRIMKRSQTLAKLFFIAILIFTTLASSYGSTTVFAQDNVVRDDTSGDFDYNPVLGEDVQVDPDFEVIAEEGDVFSEGNIRFEISDGHVESEKFFIPENSQVQLDGSTLLYSDGEFLLDGVPVATVNGTNNGDGTALQIDLSAPLENGDFEKELDSGEVQDWTINDTSQHPSKGLVNQIWLGELATKTKGRTYQSFDGNGPYTATGPNGEYTYETDVNYSGILNSERIAASIEGNEVLFSTGSGTLVKGLIDDNGNNRLELGFKSGSINSSASGYGSVFRIEAWSTPFQARAGDALYFDWRAFTVPNDTSNYDDFEVYGFIVDNEGNHTEILYGRGKDQKWTTVQKEIQEDGEYQFRFVSGSFDQTDGGKLGATLWIDNARVVSNKIVKDVVDAIGQMVHYQNPQYSGDRNVNISVTKENGETSELVDSDVIIEMMTQEEWLENGLSIIEPNEGTLLYDTNTLVTITGATRGDSSVNVSIEDPNDQVVFNGQPAVDEDGKWTIDYQEGNLIQGEYTIKATASKDGATSNAVTRIFTFVDTSELENYIADDIPVIVKDKEDYQNGWSAYQEKLTESQDFLASIENESSTPTQTDVDQVLQELKHAVEALKKHAPIEINPATYEHGGSIIVIEFDKQVTLTNSTNPGEGFTVSVAGANYPVKGASSNGNLVTLTVDQALDSDAKQVQVNYDGTTGNLYGDEQNGSADESFSIIATDEFGAGLQIVNTSGNTDDRTPTFNGSVHTNADRVSLTIKYQDREIIAGLEDVEVDLDSGKWTYTVPSNIAYGGDYTVEVTATNNEGEARTVTKSKTFYIVNKENLQAEHDAAEELVEEDYRLGWDDFEKARQHAESVLNKPTASQADVDQEITDLKDAVDALEKHAPIETDPATYEHGGNKIVIQFDKKVTLTNSENPEKGFTVSMDGTNYPVIGADSNGNSVTLTVEQALDSDAKVVQVNYDDTTGNLYGDEPNGSADESFRISATDEFGAGLQIVNTSGNTDNRTPTFNGFVHIGADSASLTFKNQDRKIIAELENVEADLESGEWTYTVPNDFAYGGDYTVEVTATDEDGDRTVTKSKTFYIVNKENLQAEHDAVDDFVEEDYRLGWDNFEKARQHAESVLNKPTASQADVDQEITDLKDAVDALEKHPPIETDPATYEHGGNKIVIQFDKKVTLTNSENPEEGFTVSVDGTNYPVKGASSNGNSVTLTVDQALDSDAGQVQVNYDGTTSNLYGDEQNGSADESFRIIATDEFGAGLQIVNTSGNTDNRTPTFNGSVHHDADSVSLTFKNQDRKVIAELENVEADLDTGEWTYTVPNDFAYGGDYTVEVTATDEGEDRTVTKSKTFYIVNKENLQAEYDVVDDFVEEDYRLGWDKFEEARQHAESVINDPTASQADVDQEITDLKDAVDALEKHPPIETDPATYEHGGNKIVIEFDKEVTLTNAKNPEEGFTVSVDGTNYPVKGASSNGNSVTLTVEQALDSDAGQVQVNYDGTTSNLYGDEQNGSSDESFSISATDEFGAGLQIVNTSGNTDDRTPTFNGSVHHDADSVSLTFKNQDRKIIAELENVEADLDSGEWTYTVPSNIAYGGDYTIEVTATDEGEARTVTKSTTFYIVNKENLQAEYDAAEELVKEDYRLGWDNFEKARQHAESVINKPTASQADVDQEIADLKVARDALEKHAPIVERTFYHHGHNNIYIVFDKDVMFTDVETDLTSGFTVSVDGKEIDIVAVERIGEDLDGKTQELKLSLRKDVELLSEIEVKVDYSEKDGNSNLSGDEENGTAVEDFEHVSSDDFGLALQISNPNAITNDTTPSILGTADKSADSASITIIGPNGEETVVDQDGLTIGSDGKWIYQVEEKLVPGEYEVVVTASEADREDVIKQHAFTVVDKEDLIKLKDMIDSKMLKGNFYTEGTWKEYSTKNSNAESVIHNPNSTQSEVDAARKELQAAYDNLLLKTVKEALDKAEIEKKLANKTKKVYTDTGGSESDDAYQDVNDELNNLEEELKKKPVELDLDKLLYRIDELKKARENLELATDQLISDQLKEAARFLTRDTAFTFSEDDTWESVTLKFLMLSEGPYDTKITWSSNQSKVISIDGNKATTDRQGSDKSVILTATISKGNQKIEKTFLVIVKRANISKKVSETTKRNASVGVNNNTSPTPSIERINLFANDNQLVNKIDKIIVNDGMVPADTTGTFSVYLPDDQANIADELALEVTADTLKKLKGILELKTDQATIVLNQSAVQSLADNDLELFFRIVPLRDETDKDDVSKRMVADQSVLEEIKKVSGSASARLVGTPKEIETNYSGYKTDIILPIGEFYHDGLDLDRLRVYIEHSDGTIDVQKGTIIYENDTPSGYKFSVDKFSTFTLFEIEVSEDSTTETVDKEENQLPSTALNMYNDLIIGVLLFGFGIFMYYVQRRRREN